MSSYRYNPTEHDDLGRSDEPNFAGTTSILGPAVGDRVIDVNRDGVAEVYGVGGALAPGCTDNNGRQPSGLCGLWSAGAGNGNVGQVIPPQTVGTQGMSGLAAPGRFTPTKNVVVRFLDVRTASQVVPPAGGTTYVDTNHKLSDSALAGTFAGQGLSTNAITPGGTAIWAWFGDWQDKNGNGVVDALEGPAPAGVDASNEFVWSGNCIQFDGSAAPDGQQYCVKDPSSVSIPLYIFPGNHHAICYGLVVGQYCGNHNPLSYGDLPARQVICFVDILSAHSTPFVCPGEIGQMEDFQADPTGGQGDPILDKQDQVTPDGYMNDRTGDATFTTRQWVYGNGWQTEFYDGSLVTTTTFVGAATHQSAADKGIPTWFDLTKATFTDVDRYTTWSPLADSLLNTQIKPTLRTNWLVVRDGADAVAHTEDSLLNERLLNDGCDTSWLQTGCVIPTLPQVVPPGTVPDPTHGVTSGNPPQGREPNTALDIEPGAVYRAFTAAQTPGLQPGEAYASGFLNDYSGYANNWHAWLNIGASHSTLYNMAWRVGGQCVLCTTGGSLGEPGIGGTGGFTPVGDTNTVLQPGTYLFGGVMAGWKDRAQRHIETVLDLPNNPTGTRTFDYTVGPDSWPGDLVNSTGTFRDRGYGAESCTIRGVTKLREWIECAHGTAESFGTNFANGGEAVQVDANPAGVQYQLRITPGALVPGPNDCWNMPVLVWRGMDTWEVGDDSAIQNYQGTCGNAAVITMNLGGDSLDNPCCGVNDELIVPEGNHGTTVYTALSGAISFQPPTVNGVTPAKVTENVRDVDVYTPYGSLLP